jgi:hypothetical protein
MELQKRRMALINQQIARRKCKARKMVYFFDDGFSMKYPRMDIIQSV